MCQTDMVQSQKNQFEYSVTNISCLIEASLCIMHSEALHHHNHVHISASVAQTAVKHYMHVHVAYPGI